MKKETKRKFNLEKFEIAKLRNQRVIIGGAGDGTQTDSTRPKKTNNPNDPDSSIPCQTYF
ncbi:hypothetical protein [Flavobacterium sp.]|uniref:hypothetical protein n=1 Tax=Flavobacterium sp. TaxID=239 RepID=UPI0040488980